MSVIQEPAYASIQSSVLHSGSQTSSTFNFPTSTAPSNENQNHTHSTISTLPPRIDLESIYDALKAGLSIDQWRSYKDGLTSFLRGHINRQELAVVLQPVINGQKQRLHNQLLLGIYQNSLREPSAVEIAPWALATNKSTNSTISAGRNRGSGATDGGDARVEARLKVEVMALAPRDRRRIKEVADITAIEHLLPSLLYDYHTSKQIRLPEPAPPSLGAPNALSSRTNWEAEISNRYNMPLACESGEFPDIEQIRTRMLPICYEEGIVGGIGEQAANFMNVASEIFVKEIISTVLSRVRSNRPYTVKTDECKQSRERREQADLSAPTTKCTARKARKRAISGGNASAAVRHRTLNEPRTLLGMDEFRLSLTLGDNFLGQMPLALHRIVGCGWDTPEDYQREFTSENSRTNCDSVLANSIVHSPIGGIWSDGHSYHKVPSQIDMGLVLGVTGNAETSMELDIHDGVETPTEWEGAGSVDHETLYSALDACLAIGT